MSRDRPERRAARRPAVRRTGRRIERLDLQAIDRDHGVAVIHQMMRQRKAGRPEPDDQHLVAARRFGQRPAQIERVPARQQCIDLEAIGQRQHVLQAARLDLRNIDRLLLLIDAGFHAVVADAVAGAGRHRIVDRDDGERADRIAARLHQVHLGDTLFERAAGQLHAERAGAEAAGLFLESGRAAILALVVTPDAVIGLVERAGQAHALVGQAEALAMAPMIARQAHHGDTVDGHGLDRHQMRRIELVRHLEQHAALMLGLALGRERRPGGIALGLVQRVGMLGFRSEPAIDMRGEAALGQRRAEACCQRGGKCFAIEAGGLLGADTFDGAALHEQSLHRIERGQFVMNFLQSLDLGRNAEQGADEILDMGRQIDQQLGLVLAVERAGIEPGRHQPVMEIDVAVLQLGNESLIEADQAVALVKLLKIQAEAEVQTRIHCRIIPIPRQNSCNLSGQGGESTENLGAVHAKPRSMTTGLGCRRKKVKVRPALRA